MESGSREAEEKVAQIITPGNRYIEALQEEDRLFLGEFRQLQQERIKSYQRAEEWQHRRTLKQLRTQERGLLLRIALSQPSPSINSARHQRMGVNHRGQSVSPNRSISPSKRGGNMTSGITATGRNDQQQTGGGLPVPLWKKDEQVWKKQKEAIKARMAAEAEKKRQEERERKRTRDIMCENHRQRVEKKEQEERQQRIEEERARQAEEREKEKKRLEEEEMRAGPGVWLAKKRGAIGPGSMRLTLTDDDNT